jgi:uncharacterized protein (DUF885 family)
MTTPFQISEDFTERWADAMPIDATRLGVGGRDDRCTDYSPDAYAGRADLYRSTRAQLESHLDDPDPVQAFAAKVLVGWLDEQIVNFDSAKWRRDLNHIYSPFQNMRDTFDVMPRVGVEAWDAIVARLDGFGGMLEGYRQCLEVGVAEGDTVARRQAQSLLEQVEAAASDESRFNSYPAEAAGMGYDADVVAGAVESLRRACAEFGVWLRQSYLPASRPEDAVGREEYLRGVDEFLGKTIDPEETYDWGWAEIERIRSAMESAAGEIDASMDVSEVIEMLRTDPERSAATRDEFVDFVSSIQQQAVERLAGEHFDVPDELKTVTVNIAPPGGSLGAWYVGPSEDFSRPGSIWYALGERERIPYWQEVSTAYHEGFPGHHLQVGTAVLQRENLSRFHRAVIWTSGSGEGWALYAERLMDELGFFEKPEYRLGLLASQLFRSCRVVVDIGSQLELTIPERAPMHGGEQWNFERAVDYMNLIALQPRDIADSEVKRYLGWWGQAISYKVGEREILAMRDKARRSADFDLKDFHSRMLAAGAIRLDHLWDVMA